MNKLYKLEDIVLKVLEEQPDTRTDDFFLVLLYYMNRQIDEQPLRKSGAALG